MNEEAIIQLHKKYAPDQTSFDLVYQHCQIVAEIALWCADNLPANTVDKEVLKTAAMLHDIGAYAFYVPAVNSFKSDGYQQHALFGATILQDEAADPRVVEAVRTHVLMGMTAKEIEGANWKLPYKDYLPQTIEAEILNYADRFHSKHPRFNDPEKFSERLRQSLPKQADKFEAAMKKFGVPDVDELSRKYQHPIH